MPFCQKGAGRRIALCVAISLALAGCYDEDDKTIPSGDTSGAAQERPEDATHWLEMGDSRAPAAFLAAESGLPPERIGSRLQALSAHYRESPRMIANRVLQMAQQHPEQPLDQLMADLVPAQGAPEHSLGPIVQQYRVQRDGGADHATALAIAMQGAAR